MLNLKVLMGDPVFIELMEYFDDDIAEDIVEIILNNYDEEKDEYNVQTFTNSVSKGIHALKPILVKIECLS